MNDLAEWQQGNERFLSAALAWLRLRLERAAQAGDTQPQLGHAAAPAAGAPPSLRRRLFRRNSDPSAPKPTVLMLPPARVTDEQINDAARAMDDVASQMSTPPAL